MVLATCSENRQRFYRPYAMTKHTCFHCSYSCLYYVLESQHDQMAFIFNLALFPFFSRTSWIDYVPSLDLTRSRHNQTNFCPLASHCPQVFRMLKYSRNLCRSWEDSVYFHQKILVYLALQLYKNGQSLVI